MKKNESDIVIIGAGLTGLTLAYYLKSKNLSVQLIEARNRIGGRIYTVRTKNSPPIELGATWIGKQHTHLLELLKELNIELFEQLLGDNAIYELNSTSLAQIVQLPPNNDPSFRIKGGSDVLITSLSKKLDKNQLVLNETISSITLNNNQVVLKGNKKIYVASKVVSTLPPHLFINTVHTEPRLPSELIEVAINTYTWMGESIKIALSFATPFWKAEGISGTIFSNVGPIPEMYDHSNFEESKFALKGFMNGSYYSISKKERLELVLTQLEKYYGHGVRSYLNYEETVWKNESYTSVDYKNNLLPHQNNGHEVYRNKFLDNRLFIAGTETSPSFGGYMEGSIRSAQKTYSLLTNSII